MIPVVEMKGKPGIVGSEDFTLWKRRKNPEKSGNSKQFPSLTPQADPTFYSLLDKEGALEKSGNSGNAQESRDSHGKSLAVNTFPRFCREKQEFPAFQPAKSGYFGIIPGPFPREKRDQGSAPSQPESSGSIPISPVLLIPSSAETSGKAPRAFPSIPREQLQEKKKPKTPKKTPENPQKCRDSRQSPPRAHPNPALFHGNIPRKKLPVIVGARPGASQFVHSRGIPGKNGIPGEFGIVGISWDAQAPDIPGFQKIFWRLGRTASLRKEKTRRIPERFPLFPLVK